jgi:hypothetical protein
VIPSGLVACTLSVWVLPAANTPRLNGDVHVVGLAPSTLQVKVDPGMVEANAY